MQLFSYFKLVLCDFTCEFTPKNSNFIPTAGEICTPAQFIAMLKFLLIALVIYLIVIYRIKVRLPHPGLQATVDVLTAADLSDTEVEAMARQYVRFSDSKNRLAPADDPHTERLLRLCDRYESVGGVPLNFGVYLTPSLNAFACADGSVRIFSGLMDRLEDDELVAIVGHEMGHVRNRDTLSAMRKAYLASAARGALSVVGGQLGAMSASQLGSLGEKYTLAQFSQKQEFAADDFSYGFLRRNGYDPMALARALDKITSAKAPDSTSAEQKGAEPDPLKGVMGLFSTHPDTLVRAQRISDRAQLSTSRG